MDKHTKEQRKKNMQAIKNKGSKIESILSKSLWKNGCRYRKNDNTIFGKPDISIKKYKIAIFCDSEFWHGKDWEVKKNEIKSNVDFWHKKIENNIRRDKVVNDVLNASGWIVLRFWGREIENNLDICTQVVITAVNQQKKKDSK